MGLYPCVNQNSTDGSDEEGDNKDDKNPEDQNDDDDDSNNINPNPVFKCAASPPPAES